MHGSHNCLPSIKLSLESILHSLHLLQYVCSAQTDKLKCLCVRIMFCWYIQRDKHFNKTLKLVYSPHTLLPSYSKRLPLGNYCWRWRNHTNVQTHRNNVKRTKQFNQMWKQPERISTRWLSEMSELLSFQTVSLVVLSKYPTYACGLVLIIRSLEIDRWHRQICSVL